MRVPNSIRISPSQIPVRVDTIDGQCQWRGVLDFEHGTLCRAFNLDPIRFFFDLPSSVRGIGSNSTGNRNGKTINGYVMQRGRNEPWGKITVCYQSEKFKDVDPQDMSEFYKLD